MDGELIYEEGGEKLKEKEFDPFDYAVKRVGKTTVREDADATEAVKEERVVGQANVLEETVQEVADLEITAVSEKGLDAQLYKICGNDDCSLSAQQAVLDEKAKYCFQCGEETETIEDPDKIVNIYVDRVVEKEVKTGVQRRKSNRGISFAIKDWLKTNNGVLAGGYTKEILHELNEFNPGNTGIEVQIIGETGDSRVIYYTGWTGLYRARENFDLMKEGLKISKVCKRLARVNIRGRSKHVDLHIYGEENLRKIESLAEFIKEGGYSTELNLGGAKSKLDDLISRPAPTERDVEIGEEIFRSLEDRYFGKSFVFMHKGSQGANIVRMRKLSSYYNVLPVSTVYDGVVYLLDKKFDGEILRAIDDMDDVKVKVNHLPKTPGFLGDRGKIIYPFKN